MFWILLHGTSETAWIMKSRLTTECDRVERWTAHDNIVILN